MEVRENTCVTTKIRVSPDELWQIMERQYPQLAARKDATYSCIRTLTGVGGDVTEIEFSFQFNDVATVKLVEGGDLDDKT